MFCEGTLFSVASVSKLKKVVREAKTWKCRKNITTPRPKEVRKGAGATCLEFKNNYGKCIQDITKWIGKITCKIRANVGNVFYFCKSPDINLVNILWDNLQSEIQTLKT